MTDKIKNYSDKLVAEIVAEYSENPNMETVKKLAESTGKTTRSLIAKLSREGVYKKKAKTTKTGEPVITKAEIVKQIAEKAGLEFNMLETLTKATKADLQNLASHLG